MKSEFMASRSHELRTPLLQGGSVALQSVRGQGSTFTVWLPWRLNADSAAPAAGMTPTVCDAELNGATVGISLAAMNDERENVQ
jgi:hypothetical protein